MSSSTDSGSAAFSRVLWRTSYWLAAAEFLIFALLFVADARHFIFLSKTPYLLALGWISLRVRKSSWRDLGLTVYRNWPLTLAMGAGAGVLLEASQLFVTQPLLVRLVGKQPDLSDFRNLTGNLKLTLIYLAATWPLAAFGEEMVYRGYLMNRIAGLLKGTRTAWIVSLIAVHLVLGLAHAYQGVTGIVGEGLDGLLLGLIYLGAGRNLAVPIIAHGVQDSIDFVLIFLGKYPGM
jgi:membrane protease YdiL (CAAX protease family)